MGAAERDRPVVGPTAAELGLPEHVPCPFCGGTRTELYSAFGPQLSVATYWCEPCRSPVEYLKWRGRPEQPGSG
jgi:hypothetical protein